MTIGWLLLEVPAGRCRPRRGPFPSPPAISPAGPRPLPGRFRRIITRCGRPGLPHDDQGRPGHDRPGAWSSPRGPSRRPAWGGRALAHGSGLPMPLRSGWAGVRPHEDHTTPAGTARTRAARQGHVLGFIGDRRTVARRSGRPAGPGTGTARAGGALTPPPSRRPPETHLPAQAARCSASISARAAIRRSPKTRPRLLPATIRCPLSEVAPAGRGRTAGGAFIPPPAAARKRRPIHRSSTMDPSAITGTWRMRPPSCTLPPSRRPIASDGWTRDESLG